MKAYNVVLVPRYSCVPRLVVTFPLLSQISYTDLDSTLAPWHLSGCVGSLRPEQLTRSTNSIAPVTVYTYK